MLIDPVAIIIIIIFIIITQNYHPLLCAAFIALPMTQMVKFADKVGDEGPLLASQM